MADREEYFRKRSLKDTARKINLTENFINGKLKKYYEIATKEIQLEIEDLYEKFADEEDITLAQAKKYISAAEFNKIDFKTSVKEALKIKDVEMLKYLNTLSKKSQITRLELLNLEVQKSISKLYNSQQTNIYEYLSNTYKDSYFRGVFNTQTYFQIGYDFVSPNENVIKQAVTRDWSKANYAKRLWNHKKELSETLREDITTGLIQGKSVNEMAKKIAKDMQVSLNNAKRLVRTETNYIHNQATLDEYTNYAHVEQYRYLATLDFKTSPICQELDGKTFNTEDAKVGRNYPPMHPNCRGTTTAYFEDEPEFIRIARDANGQTYYVPENITYKEWFDSLSEDEQGKMRLNLKQHQNHKDDVEQLKRYKKVLGKESPQNIKDFKEIKYSNKEQWEELKHKFRQKLYEIKPELKNGFKNYINPKSIPEKYKKYVNSLSGEDKEMLKQYTGFAATNLNRALRKGIVTDDLKPQIKHLDKILADGVLPEDVILKRGTIIQSFAGFENIKSINELDLNSLKNAVITDKAFGSTSLIKPQKLGRDVIMDIYAPKDFKGAVYLKPVAYDKYKYQEEILLKRNCNYKVLNAIIKENKLHLEVQLLND